MIDTMLCSAQVEHYKWARPVPTALVVLAILAVIALTAYLYRRSQGFVDRVFYRQPYDYRGTIRQVSEAMTAILDPGVIHRTLLETLVNQMQLENGVLLLPDSAAEQYRAELAVGGRPAGRASPVISFEDPLLETLESDQNPLSRHDVDLNPRFAARQTVLRARFWSLAAEVVSMVPASRVEDRPLERIEPGKVSETLSELLSEGKVVEEHLGVGT